MITVKFDNATYTVNEDVGIVQPLIVFSNPSSFIETVEILITAIGILLITYVCTVQYV